MKHYQYIALMAFFLVLQPVYSQDHHYWSQQFGSRSALMGGAVVGGEIPVPVSIIRVP